MSWYASLAAPRSYLDPIANKKYLGRAQCPLPLESVIELALGAS
jgi:hypothetical protein